MEKVIVTPRSLSAGGHPLLAKIEKAGFEVVFPSPGAQPTADQIRLVLDGAVGWLAGVERIDAATIASAKDLKAISRNGTGVDNIDLDAAEKAGVRILRAEGANARGVAELALAHILCAARSLSAASSELKAGRWTRTKGFELEGRTLGLIGCGRIGRLVARFALGFDMKVLAYDPYPDRGFAPSPSFRWAGLDEVFAFSDVITLHCPPSADGGVVVDARVLSTMKKGAVLVNTAREGLVDWPAMNDALDSGRVAWYAVDAFDKEPPDNYDILRHPRVIPSPHIGGFTEESIDRATEVAVDNLLAVIGSGAA